VSVNNAVLLDRPISIHYRHLINHEFTSMTEV